MWRPDHALDARRLAAECEAVLAGRHIDHLVARGRDVPVWAWTNALAHGSEALLRALAKVKTDRWTPSSPWIWTRARSYAAGEVLDAASRSSLADVQREVLVPLELALAASPDVARWSPQQWVMAVVSAVHDPASYPPGSAAR